MLSRRLSDLPCLLGILALLSACSSSSPEGTPGAGGGAAASGTGGSSSEGSGGTRSSGGQADGGAPLPTGGQTSSAGGAAGPSGGSSAGGGAGTGGTGAGAGSGGSPGTGAGGGSGGHENPTPVECAITPMPTVSSKIASVISLNLETDLEATSGGFVDFGADTSYGLIAPVSVDQGDLQAVLLGMPFETEVHYRITLHSTQGTCVGPDEVIATGAPPAGAPTVEASVTDPSQVTPGFVVVGHGPWATIWNDAGDLVWAYQVSFNGVTRVDFTYDAQHLIARDGNPSGQTGRGEIRKISLDGTEEETITLDRSHHDFTATPDNGLVFLVNSEDNCGKLIKMSPDGTFSELFTVQDAFASLGGSGNDLCHMNSIHYHEFDDSFTFSVLTRNAYVKISSAGELQWVLGGNSDSSFSGDSEWTRQHGHMMSDANHLIFFNNRSNGETALIQELELDTDDGTATQLLEYDGGGQSQTLGDVQKLDNGHFLVTYCNDGLQREVSGDQQPIRDFQWSTGVGYATFRPSLYGPPPAR